MEGKELRKQNFITLFRYSTPEEIEMGRRKSSKAFDKLSNGYSNKIENMSSSILQHNARVQKLDLSLKISS